MDSGDSGSLQSSSGADEECDSRAAAPVDSFSSFITNTNNRHLQPQQQSPFTTNPTTIFDPLSNYYINQTHPLLNLDSLLSHPHANIPAINPFADFQSLHFPTTHAPDTSPNNNPFPPSTPTPTPAADQGLINTAFPAPPHQQLQPPPSTSATSGPVQPVRNPKKRSRASRRAPTTVLTTDTTNFRAMVQEFTGIPAPPFASSSPFPRTRLDLFGTPSSLRSNPNVAGFHHPSPPQPPPYLLRPFPQKLQPPPPSASPSAAPLLNTNASSNTLGSFLNNNISSNDNNNNSNQNLGLGSISSFLSSKSQEGHHSGSNGNGSVMKIGPAMDEFGLINSNVIVSTTTVGTADNIANNTNINHAPANWVIGGGVGGGGQRVQATTTSTTNNF